MSSVGKLFIVVNLVLAAIFVGAGASLIGTSGDWRGKHDALQSDMDGQVADLNGQVQSITAQYNGKVGEYERQLSRVRELEADKTALEGELATERQQNADLRESFNGLDSKLGDLEQTNRSLVNRIGTLETESRSLREERDSALDARDEAVSGVTEARQSAALALGQVDNLNREINRHRDIAESADAKLATAARVYGFDPNGFGSQKHVEGVVLNVSYDGGSPIVLINKGSRDGVQAGNVFDVYAGSTFKGQIRVEVVNEANAAATISLAGDTRISDGDRFATSV